MDQICCVYWRTEIISFHEFRIQCMMLNFLLVYTISTLLCLFFLLSLRDYEIPKNIMLRGMKNRNSFFMISECSTCYETFLYVKYTITFIFLAFTKGKSIFLCFWMWNTIDYYVVCTEEQIFCFHDLRIRYILLNFLVIYTITFIFLTFTNGQSSISYFWLWNTIEYYVVCIEQQMFCFHDFAIRFMLLFFMDTVNNGWFLHQLWCIINIQFWL